MNDLSSPLSRNSIWPGFVILAFLAGCASKDMKPLDAELEMKKDIDVGVILDTTHPLQLSIPIKNVSGRVITIQRVSKDCSCTSVHVDELRLAPNQSAVLRVVSNLTGKSGPYQGNILVESDASEKVDEIQIRGRITGQIRIRPAFATVLTGDQRSPGAFTVFCDDQDGKWTYVGFAAEDPHLAVHLNAKANTPTTSVYDGSVDIENDEARRMYTAYQASIITLKFANKALGKTLEINYPVEIASRTQVSIDPTQVTFVSHGAKQTRTILVQSADALSVDAAKCEAPCIRTALRALGPNTQAIDLIFEPSSGEGDAPPALLCDLFSKGKKVGRIPINFVNIR